MTAISAGNEILARRCSACGQPIHVGQLYYGDNGGPSVHSPECPPTSEAGEAA